MQHFLWILWLLAYLFVVTIVGGVAGLWTFGVWIVSIGSGAVIISAIVLMIHARDDPRGYILYGGAAALTLAFGWLGFSLANIHSILAALQTLV
jgi:hypothetical protein